MTLKVHVVNGPNINLLGQREVDIYGSKTLTDIENKLLSIADCNDTAITFFQSNCEGSLIDNIQECSRSDVDYLIINPGAFTHTSIALRDAVLAVKIPFIEVHVTNHHSREPFRDHSFFSDIALGVTCGFGTDGYAIALNYIIKLQSEAFDISH